MTVIVGVSDGREAATAASRVFRPPGWTPTPIPAGVEGWSSFSRWANKPAPAGPSLATAYAELRDRLGACPIEAGFVGALVDNECRHDRLPTDPTPPCGCWPQEVTKDPIRVQGPTAAEATKPQTPVATEPPADLDELIEAIAEVEAAKPETPVPTSAAADLVESMVEAIDAELVRLRGERGAVATLREALR